MDRRQSPTGREGCGELNPASLRNRPARRVAVPRDSPRRSSPQSRSPATRSSCVRHLPRIARTRRSRTPRSSRTRATAPQHDTTMKSRSRRCIGRARATSFVQVRSLQFSGRHAALYHPFFAIIIPIALLSGACANVAAMPTGPSVSSSVSATFAEPAVLAQDFPSLTGQWRASGTTAFRNLDTGNTLNWGGCSGAFIINEQDNQRFTGLLNTEGRGWNSDRFCTDFGHLQWRAAGTQRQRGTRVARRQLSQLAASRGVALVRVHFRRRRHLDRQRHQ